MTERSEPPAKRQLADHAQPHLDGLSRRELLQVGAIGMLGGLASLSPAAGEPARASPSSDPKTDPSRPIALLFDEPADRSPGTVDWPVTVGVPFANGQLEDVKGLSMATGGKPAAAQFTEALRWRSEPKTVSWVHCDFQARLGGGTRPEVTVRDGGVASPPEKSVIVSDDGKHITVDTGAIKFQCSKTAFNLFDSLVAGERQVLRGSALYWRDTQGTTYEAKHVVDKVEVEKAGPLRAVIRYEGWYQSDKGAKRLRYQLWIHAFAGLPYVRIYDKMIWTENLVLYVSIDPATGQLTTKSLFADRAGVDTFVAHGWATGEEVKWTFSHSDVDTQGANQYYDNTSERGIETVVLPKVEGAALDRETVYFVRATGDATLTLHRTAADAHAGTGALKFLDQGILSQGGKTFGGRHYLVAQHPVLAEWGLAFHLAEPAARAEVDVAGLPAPHDFDLTTAKSVTASQSKRDEAELTPAGVPAGGARNLAGWAAAQFAGGAGLAVAVKGLASQNPKVLHIDGTTFAVKLWGGSAMSLDERDRVPAGFAEEGYPKEWLAFSGEPNPVGISKTHEIWLWPTRSLIENRLINDLVQRPVACCPDPAHACSTNYVLNVRPRSRTPAQLTYVEEALENLLRYLTARDEAAGDFDEWNYGDLRLFRNGTFRTWDNGGYNGCDLFWWQWYRSGRRFFLEEGINNARHVMDVDTMAHSQSVTGGYNNYLRIAGRTHVFAALQWAWPEARGDLFNDHPSYLLLCWLMTGYEVARTVLQAKCDERKEAGYGDPGNLASYNLSQVTREQYSAAPPKFVYYEFTGDERFFESGRNSLQLAMNAQAANNDKNPVGGRFFPNNGFWGFFLEAFLLSYRLKPEPVLLEALTQLISDFAVDAKTQYTAPNWKCASPTTRMGRARGSLVPFAAAYQHTGDTRYLQYSLDYVIRQCRTIQPSGPERGFDEIAGILSPLFMRGAMVLLGVWSDAGFPAITWPGNLPFFTSRSAGTAPWAAQLTLWAYKRAGTGGNIRLIFKDSNLTPLEIPGRVQVEILDPAGTAKNVLLSKHVAYSARVSAAGVVVAGGAKLESGQPVRFTAAGKLPTPLAADETYYAHVTSSGPTTELSLHRGMDDGRTGKNPLKLSGGAGALSLLATSMLPEATFSLPAAGPAGAYRIHLQSESPLFRVTPATDLPGLVVETGGLNDLRLDATLGPVDYYFRMQPRHQLLKLSVTEQMGHRTQPVAVLAPDASVLGRCDYDGGATLTSSIEIPESRAGGILTLAKGALEFSPRHPDVVPTVRLGGAERYIAVTPSQWFSPLAGFNKTVAAFWTLDEERGPRADATGNGRTLGEMHGPIAGVSDGPLGTVVRFEPPGNSWLTSTDPIFGATSGFTIWGWVRLDQLQDSRYLFVKGADVAGNPASGEWAVYALAKPTGKIYFQARAGKKYTFTPGIPFKPDRKVHFVIACYDARQKKILLQVDDGPPVSQEVGGPINVANAPLCVGGSAPNGRGWIGTIAAVGFAKAAYGARERDLLYNGGKGLQFPF